MKKGLKAIFAIFAFVLSLTVLAAIVGVCYYYFITLDVFDVFDDSEYYEFTYLEELDSYALTGVKSKKNLPEIITIPNTYKGKSVTSMYSSALSGCNRLKSVTISDSVTSINQKAFHNCSNLTSITIPDSVTTIGSDAFYGTAYYNNESNWTDGVLYIGNHLIEAKDDISGEYVIKDGTVTIAYSAFRDCPYLTSVIIGDSVANIGGYSFEDCSSLTSINISDSITSIGCDAFLRTAYYDNKSNWTDGVLYIGNHLIKTQDTIIGKYIIKDDTVTIADEAFLERSGLSGVVIPNGVKTIGKSAFSNCSILTSVTIPDSVKVIGASAFDYCDSLTSVLIGNSVTTIGNYAFRHCKSLVSIIVTANNPQYKSIDGNLYTKDETILVNYAIGKKDTSFVIPDNVQNIGDYAFAYCDSITSITIPYSVKSIGDWAFRWCRSLASISVDKNNLNYKSIEGNLYTKTGKTLIQYAIGKEDTIFEIPDSVTSIGRFAFEGCSSLASVIIPESMTTIGSDAFGGCYSLTSISIPNTVKKIGGNAFSDCNSLKDVYISDAGAWLQIKFGNYDSRPNRYATLHILDDNGNEVTELVIPDSVTKIPDYAFRNAKNITSITIPDSVTTIGSVAFFDCDSLTSITIPDSVTSIGSSAFYLCDSLASITIPDGVTSIGYSAFSGTAYYNDESNWVNGVLYIGNHLIEAKDTISGEYVIKDGTITVADRAFLNCDSLASITIPDSVTTIGYSAFSHCSRLTSITIPDSVTSIGDSAFLNCDSLKDVYYTGTEEEWYTIEFGLENSYLINVTIHYNYVPKE